MRTRLPGQSALLLLDVAEALRALQIDYAVIGALAAAIHGMVRASVDADAVASLTVGESRTLERQLADRGFAVQLRVGDHDDPIPALLAVTDEHENRVDLRIGLRGLERAAFDRTVVVPFMGSELRVVGREDFVAMKAYAGAAKDLDDAHAVLASAPVDVALLRRIALRFGTNTAERVEALLRVRGA